METLPYIDLEVTPGVETHSVDSEGISQAVNVLFPFGTSLEPSGVSVPTVQLLLHCYQ